MLTAKCGSPPAVPFAEDDAPHQQQFDLGTTIKYLCVEGTSLSNGQSIIKAKCLLVNETALWVGLEMTCTRK